MPEKEFVVRMLTGLNRSFTIMGSFVKSYIVMGVFAFAVALISLLRVMSYSEFHRLTAMKRAWGRRNGLALYFVSAVVLPLLCGVVFFSGGISGVKLNRPLIVDKPFDKREVAPVVAPDENIFSDPFNIAA